MNFVPLSSQLNVYNQQQFFMSQQQNLPGNSTFVPFQTAVPPVFYHYPIYNPSLQYRDPGLFREDDSASYCSPSQYSVSTTDEVSNHSSPENNIQSPTSWSSGKNCGETLSPKKEDLAADDEKRNSTLWKMINEINDMDELAISMSGTKPIPNLRVEDVEEFERSDQSNAEMPTDDFVINLSKEDAMLYKDL